MNEELRDQWKQRMHHWSETIVDTKKALEYAQRQHEIAVQMLGQISLGLSTEVVE